MNYKKLNIIPGGKFIILMILFLLILFIIIGLILMPSEESIYLLLIFPIIFIIIIIDYILSKHLSYIYVSEDEIYNKNYIYKWKDVYITMKYSNQTFRRNSYDYYFYFNDHYLSIEECNSKNIKKKGFYLLLTKKRVNFLLSSYNKEVKILNEAPRAKKILEIVEKHNEVIKNKEAV